MGELPYHALVFTADRSNSMTIGQQFLGRHVHDRILSAIEKCNTQFVVVEAGSIRDSIDFLVIVPHHE